MCGLGIGSAARRPPRAGNLRRPPHDKTVPPKYLFRVVIDARPVLAPEADAFLRYVFIPHRYYGRS